MSSTLKGLRGSNNTLQQITAGEKHESAVPQGIEKINCDKIQQDTIEWTIIGKDEVGSSNLPSSSKKPLKSLDLGGFFIPDGSLERRGPVEDRISGIQSFRGLSAGADLAWMLGDGGVSLPHR